MEIRYLDNFIGKRVILEDSTHVRHKGVLYEIIDSKIQAPGGEGRFFTGVPKGYALAPDGLKGFMIFKVPDIVNIISK